MTENLRELEGRLKSQERVLKIDRSNERSRKRDQGESSTESLTESFNKKSIYFEKVEPCLVRAC